MVYFVALFSFYINVFYIKAKAEPSTLRSFFLTEGLDLYFLFENIEDYDSLINVFSSKNKSENKAFVAAVV
jgi:hypothetical protein